MWEITNMVVTRMRYNLNSSVTFVIFSCSIHNEHCQIYTVCVLGIEVKEIFLLKCYLNVLEYVDIFAFICNIKNFRILKSMNFLIFEHQL